mmetsp:Transcript_4750/g.8294  ORF Transcript_4750/g.8294 Transcript_4750/m.8294 type:complete len:330 (-) Transcript_4750:53-1042(-)
MFGTGLSGRLLFRRSYASAAAAAAAKSTSSPSNVDAIVSHASRSFPMKDAFKFLETTARKTLMWTYRDTARYSSALAGGLQEIGYSKGDKILVWIPYGSPEFLALSLAAAKLGVIIVPVTPPVDKSNADLNPVVDALDVHAPKGFVFWHEFSVALPEDFVWRAEEDGICALTERLFPGIRSDTKGLHGLTRSTGVPFSSPRFPTLKHVVHTGPRNWRQLIQLRSLMGMEMSGSVNVSDSDVFMESGSKLSHKDVLSTAKKVGGELQLSGDHTLKTGRVVIPTAASAESVMQNALSALLNESLGVFPGYSADATVAQALAQQENALLASA